MFTNFRLKLTMILIIFSLILSILIAVFDYVKLQNTVLVAQETKIAMAEDKIIDNLSTIDKVYDLFDVQTTKTMEAYSMEMIEMYEEESDFTKWDFDSLKEKYKMDIFILDHTNTVIHSSFPEDVGLSFQKCCPGFSNLLDERREGELFTSDGMDIQAKTGEVKKFSYMPTPDHKYLIELGFLLEDQEIFKQFNFLKSIDELVEEYDVINSIKVYNSGGNALGVKTENFKQEIIQPPFREVFEKVRGSGNPEELMLLEDGNRVTYRYIPYSADERKGFSTNRVVEIAYNHHEMTELLAQYKNQFLLQLLVILFGSVLLSFLIARLVSKPIHMAFHDSLTGLKNRLAVEDEITRRLERKNSDVALMMIDLDNFKSVNDCMGHGEGDRILKIAAATIQDTVGPGNFAARVGGDEFLVLIDRKESPNVKRIADNLLHRINEKMEAQLKEVGIQTSISIGVALATEQDNFETLYEKADQALYQSKENGKNQYKIFHPILE
ncbi:GGDEF domain-containing protein [Sporosarcina sp. ACRSL]|uniref:GGDEF domain-containing protein n=1 Tax=Sporosarcina sp. ACRSL TaxID=2918215 RepID=UPI001EF44B4E|nr:GGDEF domain-containing protein [Sporosarcina sp. ACRSL]MCG7346065.1 GGDEF domain-containing protein [Sporosarcina sp. ACRSL]